MAGSRDGTTFTETASELVSALTDDDCPAIGETPIMATLGTPSGGNLLKRSEAARALGVSVSTLRRMEGTTLRPIVGPDGVRLFRSEEVHELTVRRVRMDAPKPSDYDGETAARVFELLDEGVHPVDVVKRTKLDPRAVSALHKEWIRMRGGFIVAAAQVRELEGLPWLDGIFPIETADVLLENLRTSGPRACARCKRREPAICPGCARNIALGEAKRIDDEALERRARVAASKQRAARVRDDEQPSVLVKRPKMQSHDDAERTGDDKIRR